MKDLQLVWRRSTKCEAGACLLVATTPAVVLVRDGKDPDGPVLSFDPDAWTAFLVSLRGGEGGDS